MIKLFVGGFPMDITEMELVMMFGLHGDVDTIKIVRDKKTGECKGYAFLEMKDKEGAERAIDALDGSYMGDRMLSVKVTEDKTAAPPARRPAPKFSRSFPSKPSYQKVERPGVDVKKKRPRKEF
jgi:RNA recognition motif-containing protein